MRPMRYLQLLPLMLTVLASSAAQGASWISYIASQYRVDLPTDTFRKATTSGGVGHLTLEEVAGNAIIDVYTGNNIKRLSPAAFIEQLSHAPRIADISYQAQGHSWFAISGHYKRDTADPGTLIYYAKFVFSADLARFVAFEISYSVAEKSRMDATVTRLEKTLSLR